MLDAVMLTTDEYKKLILEEKELEEAKEEINVKNNQLAKAREEVKDLLLILTVNKLKAPYGDDKFEGYQLERYSIIADYINENYVDGNGMLLFEKVEKKTKEEECIENE